jgi:hypothetical protein
VDNFPVIPATSIQEIKNRLLPFVEAGVDRLIVPYVPVTEPVIDDGHRFVEAWDKSWSALINESKPLKRRFDE